MTLCNMHETRILSGVFFFICHKSSTCKIQEGDDLLDHTDKVKAFVDWLIWKVPVRNKDVVMSLLVNVLSSYGYLITALETMPMKELTMKYVMMHLMHEMSKNKGKKNPNVMILQCCCVKANHAISSIQTTIVANRTTLCIFVTQQRTRTKRMQTTQKIMMTTHLQYNMVHIHVSES